MLTFVKPGPFIVPVAATGPVSVTAGVGAYAATRTELIAAAETLTALDFFIIGYTFTGPGTYSAFKLYTGASTGELLGEEPVGALASVSKAFPLPFLVAGGTRVTVDAIVASGSAACKIGLLCVGRANVIDDQFLTTGALTGMVTPVTNTMTDLVTVPANRFAANPVVFVNNKGAVDQLYAIAMSPLGASYVSSHDIVTKAIIKAGESLSVPIPMTLQGTDKIRVWTNGNAPAVTSEKGYVLAADTSVTFSISGTTRS